MSKEDVFTVEKQDETYHFAGGCRTVGQNDGGDRWTHGWQEVVDNPVQEPLLSLSCANC